MIITKRSCKRGNSKKGIGVNKIIWILCPLECLGGDGRKCIGEEKHAEGGDEGEEEEGREGERWGGRRGEDRVNVRGKKD